LSNVTATDIIVVPTHAMSESRVLGQWKVARAFVDTSIVVVGGPHRLSVGGNGVQASLHGVVDATDASTA
jgi:hypothetical protein